MHGVVKDGLGLRGVLGVVFYLGLQFLQAQFLLGAVEVGVVTAL